MRILNLLVICCISVFVLAACKGQRSHDGDKTVVRPTDTISKNENFEYDSSNANGIRFDSMHKIRIGDTGNTFSEEAMIAYKGCRVVVKSTFIKDSVSPDEPNLFNPICARQQILFYSNNAVLKTLDYPVRIITQKNTSGKKEKMLENVINDLGFIKSKAGFVVIVSGWGGCNTCSSFDGLFSPKGDVLAIKYGTEYETYDSVGDIDKVAERLGIDSRELDRMTWSSIKVYAYPKIRL
jgi:hypothetical protein